MLDLMVVLVMKLAPLYQLIDLDTVFNVEVIPHISIKVRRWLKGCIRAVLGLLHQNELEQIVTTVLKLRGSTATKLRVSDRDSLEQ